MQRFGSLNAARKLNVVIICIICENLSRSFPENLPMKTEIPVRLLCTAPSRQENVNATGEGRLYACVEVHMTFSNWTAGSRRQQRTEKRHKKSFREESVGDSWSHDQYS